MLRAQGQAHVGNTSARSRLRPHAGRSGRSCNPDYISSTTSSHLSLLTDLGRGEVYLWTILSSVLCTACPCRGKIFPGPRYTSLRGKNASNGKAEKNVSRQCYYRPHRLYEYTQSWTVGQTNSSTMDLHLHPGGGLSLIRADINLKPWRLVIIDWHHNPTLSASSTAALCSRSEVRAVLSLTEKRRQQQLTALLTDSEASGSGRGIGRSRAGAERF